MARYCAIIGVCALKSGVLSAVAAGLLMRSTRLSGLAEGLPCGRGSAATIAWPCHIPTTAVACVLQGAAEPLARMLAGNSVREACMSGNKGEFVVVPYHQL